jgi:hypothetical protein
MDIAEVFVLGMMAGIGLMLGGPVLFLSIAVRRLVRAERVREFRSRFDPDCWEKDTHPRRR